MFNRRIIWVINIDDDDDDKLAYTFSYFPDQVTNITEEKMEHQGNSLLCLKTENGIIKLMFEDEMQSKIWISTILNLLTCQS